MMKLYGPDNGELIQITSLEAEDGKLVMKGKVFGTMPLTAKLTGTEARNALRLLNFRLVVFLLTFLFRS
ncbi:MAG TPA: hypothetical protein VEJ38_08375 [Candidatus Acidoferrales bacterium]|nr:hypothetical protein [Candidatus Acidoferrales bacterium]